MTETLTSRIRPMHVMVAILVVSAFLRFQGLDWGTDRQTGKFHRFHPDEVTMLNNARLVGVDLREVGTAYGNMPAYIQFGVAHVAGWVAGIQPYDWKDNRSTRFTHLVGRALSATIGLLTIGVVFLLGRRLDNPWTGVLAAGLLGFSPGHIQQSHYFTVDVWLSFFVALSVLTLYRLPSTDLKPYLIAGLVCGLAAGTRMIAAGLALPFVLIHVWPSSADGTSIWKRLRIREVFAGRSLACFGIVMLMIFFSEPYLFLDPEAFFGGDDMLNFLPSVEVTRGETIRIWVLYDFSTTRYLFYVTHLLRYALGAPLEVAGLVGIGLAAWRRDPRYWAILLWLFPYFAVVGGFHAKPIRYTTPMMPFFAVLGAVAILDMGRRIGKLAKDSVWRGRAAALPALAVVLPTIVLGTARASIYAEEDGRIEAARWVRNTIPEGESVLTERGGFSTTWMVPADRYKRGIDQATFFIASEGQYLYSDKIDFIGKRLDGVGWIVIVDENRLRQYKEAKEQFPIAWEYYTRLEDGTLGYDRVARFKVAPRFFGWTIDESRAEPTVTAFDHPTVSVYRRTRDNVDAMVSNWREEIAADARYPDTYVIQGLKAYRQEDYKAAENSFRKSLEPRPGFSLGHVMMFEAFKKQGKGDSANHHLRLAKGRDGLTREVLMGLVKAGMRREGIAYLHGYVKTLGLDDPRNVYLLRFAAQTWFDLGVESFGKRELETAVDDFLKVVELLPEFAPTHTNLGNIYIRLEDYTEATRHLQTAVTLDSTESEPYLRLGQVARLQGGHDQALAYVRKALSLEPEKQMYLQELMRQGVGRYNEKAYDEAAAIYEAFLTFTQESQQAQHNLGLARFSQKRFGDALQCFLKATELDPNVPATRYSLGCAYEALGRKQDAIAAFRRALLLEPDNANAQKRLNGLLAGAAP